MGNLGEQHRDVLTSSEFFSHTIWCTYHKFKLYCVGRLQMTAQIIHFSHTHGVPFLSLVQRFLEAFSTPNKSSEWLVVFPTFIFTASSFELVKPLGPYSHLLAVFWKLLLPFPEGFLFTLSYWGEGLEPSNLGQPLRNCTGWTRTKPNRDWPVTTNPFVRIKILWTKPTSFTPRAVNVGECTKRLLDLFTCFQNIRYELVDYSYVCLYERGTWTNTAGCSAANSTYR